MPEQVTKEPTTVREMAEAYLKENGFDGLFSPGECSCKVGDLMPCGNANPECKAGVFLPNDDPDYEFIIGPKSERDNG